MNAPVENYQSNIPADKTSLTDDERIENIVPLPPPENLIRFFPIQHTRQLPRVYVFVGFAKPASAVRLIG